MKISLESRLKMQESIEATCKAYNVNLAKIVSVQHMFSIWNIAYMLTAYPDSNPNALKDGKRVIPYNPDFAQYPDNSHDNHIKTALKWIFSQLSKK